MVFSTELSVINPINMIIDSKAENISYNSHASHDKTQTTLTTKNDILPLFSNTESKSYASLGKEVLKNFGQDAFIEFGNNLKRLLEDGSIIEIHPNEYVRSG